MLVFCGVRGFKRLAHAVRLWLLRFKRACNPHTFTDSMGVLYVLHGLISKFWGVS